MGAVLSSFGPRIVIPGFFMRNTLATESSKAKIAKMLAFSFLFVTAVVSFFRGRFFLSLIPGIAAAAYFYMQQDPAHTQLYRYADWSCTTPLMLAAVLLAVKSAHLPQLIVADILMIGTGYMGVQAADPKAKAAWFTLGVALFVPIVLALWNAKGALASRILTLVLWSLYPIVWASIL
jgi:bacteriorhodopsin